MLPPSICQLVSTWAWALSPFLLAGINCPHSTSLPICMLYLSPQLLRTSLSFMQHYYSHQGTNMLLGETLLDAVPVPSQPLPRSSALLYKETPEEISMMCLQLLSWPPMNPLHSGWVSPLLPNSSYPGLQESRLISPSFLKHILPLALGSASYFSPTHRPLLFRMLLSSLTPKLPPGSIQNSLPW